MKWNYWALVGAAVLACACGDDEAGVSEDAGAGMLAEGKRLAPEPEPQECPGGGLMPGDHSIDLTFDGVDYVGNVVHVPPGYDGSQRTPLVLNWHGYMSNAAQQVAFSGFSADADEAGVIVAYPNSPNSAWEAGLCCNFATERDDVGFARALVAELESQLCINPHRIYSTGMSNGGFMTHQLACAASDLIAAIAPVAGNLGVECEPERPVPVMAFHGTEDTLVPFEGGGTLGSFPLVQDTIDDWAARNGCDAEATQTLQEGAVTCHTYDGCDAQASVTLCVSEGTGHCWQGSAFCPFGEGNTDVSGNREMLSFFEQHWLP